MGVQAKVEFKENYNYLFIGEENPGVEGYRAVLNLQPGFNYIYVIYRLNEEGKMVPTQCQHSGKYKFRPAQGPSLGAIETDMGYFIIEGRNDDLEKGLSVKVDSSIKYKVNNILNLSYPGFELSGRYSFLSAEEDKNYSDFNGITYNFVQEKPGTILSYIQAPEVEKIDSLTIVGLLDERDVAIINRMTDLKYLDLSNTYITYSPDRKKAIAEDRAARAAIAQLLGDAVEQKHKSGEMDDMSYSYNKTLTDLMMTSTEVNVGSDPCFVPTIKGLTKLRTVKLPLTARWIDRFGFSNCTNLENVELPELLEKIDEGCFQNTKISKLVFPATFYSLYCDPNNHKVFVGCNNLSELDFSKCTKMKKLAPVQIAEINLCPFANYLPSLKIVRMSPSWTSRVRLGKEYGSGGSVVYYIPATISNLQVERYGASDAPILKFSSSTPPARFNIQGGYGKKNTPPLKVYIPKGSLNDYYAVMAFDYNIDFIEE